jgi:hypothetical protein
MAASPSLLAQSGSIGVSFNAGNGPSGQWSQLPPFDQLVAPVALYPDPLLGLVLPAATAPNDLQNAASTGGGAVSDPAVQGLTHYPEVLNWMAANLDWSQQLGGAFADQPNQVMDAVQDLRRRAIAAGTLRSNDQVVVLQTNGIIQIIPRQADVMYVPRYDAESVYFRGGRYAAITWSGAVAAGAWLSFYPAWDRHAVYTGDFYDYSRSHGGWDRADLGRRGFFASGSAGVRNAREWRVSSSAQIRRSDYRSHEAHGQYARPNTMGTVGFNGNGERRDTARFQNRSQDPYASSDRGQRRENEARANLDQRRSTFAGDDFSRSPAAEEADHRADEFYRQREEGQNRVSQSGRDQRDREVEQARSQQRSRGAADERVNRERTSAPSIQPNRQQSLPGAERENRAEQRSNGRDHQPNAESRTESSSGSAPSSR